MHTIRKIAIKIMCMYISIPLMKKNPEVLYGFLKLEKVF